MTTAYTRASVAAYEDDLPRSLTTYRGTAVPPGLDVARLIADDARDVLRFHPRSTRSDRLAGFLRVAPDGTLYPIERDDVAEILADLLDRIVAEILEWATHARDPYAVAATHALRSYRDALARLSPRPTSALLSRLRSAVEVPRVEVERHALRWLDAWPRERVLRSTVTESYAADGSPGGLNARELLALIRRTLGEDIETMSKGEVYLSLNRYPAHVPIVEDPADAA